MIKVTLLTFQATLKNQFLITWFNNHAVAPLSSFNESLKPKKNLESEIKEKLTAILCQKISTKVVRLFLNFGIPNLTDYIFNDFC